MGLLPTTTLLTNELRLFDYKGTKASLTFGDADINDGYSYLRLNFRADDSKFDFWQDKPVINFIANEAITFNDKKIWHEDNDGPMSGLNADMLDGLHSSEFKDRNGHNHFGHACIPGGEKMFVKIATFTPRRVGNCPDFNTEGTPPFQGIFADNIVKRMEARAKFHAFMEDTPERLGPIGINGFEHTDMSSEGVYNSTLRASISLLKKGSTDEPPWQGPETVDVHVGIFEDPVNQDDDGWSCTSRYFYVSGHERNLPFIKEHDDPEHDYIVGGNVVPVADGSSSPMVRAIDKIEYVSDKMTATEDEPVKTKSSVVKEASSKTTVNKPELTKPEIQHTDSDHSRPPVTGNGYAIPPDPTKNDYVAQKFPRLIEPGFSYQKDLESFRLYHVDSHVDIIDGVKVVTHKFDLYMAVDTKTEVHVQPYMSSSCLFFNYQKPVSESDLPQVNFMMPKSVYDTRYAHVEHRHRNYEMKMEDMDEEISQIWKVFDGYVVIDQGSNNANKVLMTDSSGKVVCEVDNIERHKDARRYKERVLVTDKYGCIAESTITTLNLAQLYGVKANIQQQIDLINLELGKMPDGDAYVRKSGDTMTGNLHMKNSSTISVNGADDAPKERMVITTRSGYSGLFDSYEQNPICGLNNEETSAANRIFFIQKNSFRVGGRSTGYKVTISGTAPSNPAIGDIWIKNK